MVRVELFFQMGDSKLYKVFRWQNKKDDTFFYLLLSE